MLLFTRTTGERCSLPKYSIRNVLTVLVKPVITFNALSHLSPVLLLPARAVHLDFQLLNYLFGPCWSIDNFLSVVDRIMTSWEQKATYKRFPIPQAVNGMLETVPHPASCQRHA